MIADILKQFFRDQLGPQYDVGAFRNAVQNNAPSTEVMRVIKSTDEIISEMLKNNKIRAVLRTSQSDYIGLSEADGASFTWSLEFAAPLDGDVDGDTERAAHQRTALQTFTNAVGLSVHATKNDPIIRRMIAASAMGDVNGFAFEVRQHDDTVAMWEVALLNQVNVAASLGSFVLIDVQILRS